MIELVRACLEADVPVLLRGAPGTGKTAVLLAEAANAGSHIEVLIGSTLDPLDVGGYLLPTKTGVRSVAPPWATRIRAALDARKPAWLMLDELSCAPPSVQAALLRVVHERRVGELDLAGCRVVAASNPGETAADGGELSGASANRWAHFDWVPDVGAWVAGTLRNWGRGHATERASGLAASVAAFVQRNPQALLSVPTGLSELGWAWPSPRSWTAAIAAASAGSDAIVLRLASGCVGEGAAKEWYAHHAARDLPDPEYVLAGTAKVPTRGDRAAATLSAVVACALLPRDDRSARVARAWAVVVSVRADVAVTAAKALLDATDQVPEIAGPYAARLRGGGVE